MLEFDSTLDLNLHLGSLNHELAFEVFYLGLNQLNFPPKLCHIFASIWHFLVSDPHSKARGSIYDSQSIGLLYFIEP
jgi:hypothetical protein